MTEVARPSVTVEQFLVEAGQLHQTWIRRFDTQHRRRPRPPEIEAERLRLVRRLQLLQRLQSENLDAEGLIARLGELGGSPREARLVDGDTEFVPALLTTWMSALMPQAATMAAGAKTPTPSSTVEFRW